VTLLVTAPAPLPGASPASLGKSRESLADFRRPDAGTRRAQATPVPSLRHRPRAQQGFTLAELLVVIAMVGVMSALAVVSYRKYVTAAQSSEAKAIIQGIRVGEESYKSEMLLYLSCSAGFTDYYPKSPDDSPGQKMNWAQSTDTRYTNAINGWQLLNVQADGPVRFSYTVQAGVAPAVVPDPPDIKIAGWPPKLDPGTPWYVVQATYKPTASSRPVVFVGSSFTSEIFAEND
jgi:type IV pilus assembly protein PilA